jgi:hypothetical protein
MGCLKCGKETGVSSVFCDYCLLNMAAYPVKPDIAVQLPQRNEDTEEKKPVRKKKQLTPAELVKRANRRSLYLAILSFLLLLSLVGTGFALTHTLDALETAKNQGKNYTTVVS